MEVDLPGNYDLFGNNSKEETAIWFETGKHRSEIIVEEVVFAVGYNNDFIIAKSYNKNSKFIFEDKNPEFINSIEENDLISYHIIDLKEKSPKKNKGMSFTEYKNKRKELKIPENLNFTIIIK